MAHDKYCKCPKCEVEWNRKAQDSWNKFGGSMIDEVFDDRNKIPQDQKDESYPGWGGYYNH